METLDREDFEVRVQGNGVDYRTRESGGLTVSWAQLAKGTDLGPALKGLPGDLCQCPHWGYMIKGRVRMRTKSGDQVFEAGQPFYWGPGHAPEALEDCEYVDFSPTDELETVLKHVTSGG